MRLTDDPEKICKCGHAIWYHGGKCTFVGCNCWKYSDPKKSKPKKEPQAFLSGFTYTEDQICKCKHGSWDHERGGCIHYIKNKNKKSRKKWTFCPCKKFESKVKVKKVREVKRWPTKTKQKPSSKSVRRVKKK